MIAEQIARARKKAGKKDGELIKEKELKEAKELQREESWKIKLSVGVWA